MGIIKEFKEFAMRGNVLDMAVGVVVGGAFGKNRHVTGQQHYYAPIWGPPRRD